MIHKARKFIIFCVSLLAVVGAFLIYSQFFKTPDINVDQQQEDVPELELPKIDPDSAKIGDIAVGNVQSAKYTVLDENKNVKRVFGFDTLLNPKAGTKNWELEKPYMDLYQNNFTYEITSDKGSVVMETIAGNPTPISATLKENVVIEVRRKADDIVAATIYLDNLDYDSELSQFSTPGPLRLVSDEADMEGTGMVLVYNEAANRLELLRITDVEYILFKNVNDPSGSSNESAMDTPRAASAMKTETTAKTEPVKIDNAGNKENAQLSESEPVGEPEPQTQPKVFYQCRLYDNVVIEYGPDIVVLSDDRVIIRNLVFNDSESGQDQVKTSPVNKEQKTQGDIAAKPETVKEKPAGSDATDNIADSPDTDEIETEGVNVRVTCRGGLEVIPMPGTDTSYNQPERTIEFLGTPVKINQLKTAAKDKADKLMDDIADFTTIALCARLHYNLDTEVLNMFPDSVTRFIRLRMSDEETSIETEGKIHWEKPNRTAVIEGPGKLYTVESSGGASQGRSEMNFGGRMDLFFAESDVKEGQDDLVLESCKLDGGMNALVYDESPSMIRADAASFYFRDENIITRADLDGNVYLTADLDMPDNEKSTIEANFAKIDFADAARLKAANMSGDVRFASPQGKLTSQKAHITFATDSATGKTYPAYLSSTEQPELISAPVEEKTTAGGGERTRFRARQIDYDITTENAFAHGPVEFIFTPSEVQNSGGGMTKPVIITSQENAQYLAARRQVIFNGDVVGTRLTEYPEYRRQDNFYGDKLVVDLTVDQQLRHVSVQGQTVKLKSDRFNDEKMISQTQLICDRFDYDDPNGLITALGPGNIQINNENAEPQADSADMDLSGPCFAYIDGFERLNWHVNDNFLTARGDEQSVNIAYMPVQNGQKGKITRASTTRLRAEFREGSKGSTELDELTASDGITYIEQEGNELIGERLYYNPDNSVIEIDGRKGVHCLVNGARAENIRYNLVTGEIKFEIPSTPGAVLQ